MRPRDLRIRAGRKTARSSERRVAGTPIDDEGIRLSMRATDGADAPHILPLWARHTCHLGRSGCLKVVLVSRLTATAEGCRRREWPVAPSAQCESGWRR